jgi:hypothetical protein
MIRNRLSSCGAGRDALKKTVWYRRDSKSAGLLLCCGLAFNRDTVPLTWCSSVQKALSYPRTFLRLTVARYSTYFMTGNDEQANKIDMAWKQLTPTLTLDVTSSRFYLYGICMSTL